MNELLDKLANDHAHGDGNGATRYETLRVATVNNVKIYGGDPYRAHIVYNDELEVLA